MVRSSDRLPNEILIEVASSLDMADLLSISQTHRSWRQILTSAPHLWTKLIIKSEVRRPSHHQLIKLFEHVLMVAERSRHSLEHVVLRVHSPGHWARQMHHILQLSAATLKHIELYAPNQHFMYMQLYRFCPLLRKLVFLNYQEVSIPVSPITAQMLPVKELPPIQQREAKSFHLEEFHAGDIDDLQMDKHLDKVRVLTGFNPVRWHVEAGVLKLNDERFVTCFTEHLEHWQGPQPEYEDDILRHHPDLPLTLRLPKLKTLLNIQLQPEFTAIRLACPNLLEMRVSTYDGSVGTTWNLLQILKTTTRLQKLTFADSDLDQDDEVAVAAIRDLPDLQYLELDYSGDRFAAKVLLPRAAQAPCGDRELILPLPKLDTLLVDADNDDIQELTESLMIRELLRSGLGLTKAIKIAAEEIHSLSQETVFRFSPLEWELNTRNSSLVIDMDQGPRLKDASQCGRLKELVVMYRDDKSRAMWSRILENVTDKLSWKQ